MQDPQPDLEKQALDHAWRWFEYHATQRMMTIRFYLIVSGAIGSGVGYLWANHSYFFGALLSTFGVISSVCFVRLDLRVSHLVKLGEAALKEQQRNLAESLKRPKLEICEEADKLKSSNGLRQFRYPYTYTENISVLVRSATIAFAIASIVCLLAFAKVI